MTTTDQLFQDYNYYRFHTKHYKDGVTKRNWLSRSLKPTSERLKALEAMNAWCSGRNINPRHWLYTLFQARQWVFSPRFDHLTSPKHLKRYKTMITSPMYDNRMRELRAESDWKEGKAYDPNRDLSGTVEALKRKHLASGDAERCMAEINTTLGFHPKSTVCARCPLAQSCSVAIQQRVPFDIQALRRGEMTSDQARMVAYTRAGHVR